MKENIIYLDRHSSRIYKKNTETFLINILLEFPKTLLFFYFLNFRLIQVVLTGLDNF